MKHNLHLKGIAICLLLLLCNLNLVSAQVGIGTITPDASSAIDVSSTTAGALFPRMTAAQRDLIANPATGLLIYNTTTNTFDYNSGTSGTPNWISLGSTVAETRSVRYTNTDTATDLNITPAAPAPLFGAETWNDDTSLFTIQDANTIVISETGRYRITTNILLVGGSDNTNVISAVLINGVIVSANISDGYISGLGFPTHTQTSINFSELFEVTSENSTLQIFTFQEGDTGTVTQAAAGVSSVTVEKIN